MLMIHSILYLSENIVQINVYMYNIMFKWAELSIKQSEVIKEKTELPVFDSITYFVSDGLKK
jgi:hypothetical protein